MSLLPHLSLFLPFLQHFLYMAEAKANLCRAPGTVLASPRRGWLLPMELPMPLCQPHEPSPER